MTPGISLGGSKNEDGLVAPRGQEECFNGRLFANLVPIAALGTGRLLEVRRTAQAKKGAGRKFATESVEEDKFPSLEVSPCERRAFASRIPRQSFPAILPRLKGRQRSKSGV
ncbi:hypothetical protein KM043_012981 [Ampulex compressa]|nr:hypothetical protein KM043_012981 [Ampulex compressa]